MPRLLSLTLLSGVLLTVGLAMRPRVEAAPAPAEQQFADILKKAAAEYRDYGRVDDEMRWAPYLCRMPMPGVAHVSASKDDRTHGQKLYSLFVKQRDAYGFMDAKKVSPAPVGQVIIKQSWVPDEVVGVKIDGQKFREGIIVTPTKEKQPALFTGDHFWPYAQKDGKVFKAAKQADLFIMVKLDPMTPGTDDGWVYGTVTPDGKQVTSSGRVQSCMKCHQDAKNDRQFGLQGIVRGVR